MSKHHTVAIIGAGIAGLSCATALKNAIYNVTIFEKSRGVSGRVSTLVRESWQCDQGAQYITARDPLFNAEIQRWLATNVVQLWQPELKVFDGKTFSPKLNENESNNLRYVGYPRNHSPAKWLAESLNVVTETTVTSIEKTSTQWQLTSKEHGVNPETFDYVILSIPAPQAAAVLKESGSTLASLSGAVLMRPCFALMVHFKQRIHCQFDGLFINSGILSWAARDSSKPGRLKQSSNETETWVLHATSHWSEANVDLSKELVSKLMLAEFMSILECDSNLAASALSEVRPDEYDLHRWLYADCEHYLTDVYQFDAAYNIGLCGDWLNGGKVQGAWLSGYKLAQALIDSYGV